MTTRQSWKSLASGERGTYSGTMIKKSTLFFFGFCGLMVSALDSGLSGPGSGPARGHCVVFLGKTLYTQGASLHPGV